MNRPGAEPPAGRAGFDWRRLWPLAVLAAGLVAAKAAGLDAYLSFNQLQAHRGALLSWVAANGSLAVLVYCLLYVLVVAFSLPGGAVMTVAGGFLFGQWLGTGLVVVSATLGSVLVFLAARSALGDHLAARAGPWLGRMRAGFNENALSYMLFLRLIPIFPFFVVNLVPAFLGVRLATYTIGTVLGIMPGSFVFASFGAGIGALFDRGERLSLSAVLTPEILTALFGLGLLALLPVAYRKLRARRKGRARDPFA
ncbi:TVP38/TMEM64 family protein [Marivibrio halodurans]|uniref:TVP38/TMEM64 family membrane protein n=2 Tax=Marivibrio halodurans TaxID=2039722 RepID=A0A8J7S171_9PROT|nr:TVP38/TMEM64 family protein [Marivibrio halodurans]